MDNNKCDTGPQIFKPLESDTVDSYYFDVDPDAHFFSSVDISKLCGLYNEDQFNDLLFPCLLIYFPLFT